MSAERASSAGPARAGPLQAQAAARFALCSIHDASSSLQLSKLQDMSGETSVSEPDHFKGCTCKHDGLVVSAFSSCRRLAKPCGWSGKSQGGVSSQIGLLHRQVTPYRRSWSVGLRLAATSGWWFVQRYKPRCWRNTAGSAKKRVATRKIRSSSTTSGGRPSS